MTGASRVSETPLGRVEQIVELLTPALRERMDRPFAFFGHDLGAIVMFEVVRRLRRAGCPLPSHLFVSATMAPHIYYFPPIHYRPTAKLLETLRMFEIPLDAGEAVLRADCGAMASYTYHPEPPLDVPLTAFLGEQDGFVPAEAVRAWKEQTTMSFAVHAYPGDHYFLRSGESDILRIIRAVLGPMSSDSER